MVNKLGIVHISDFKLRGFVQAYVRRAACPDINELVFEDENVIENTLKINIRSTFHTSVDFALDNLRATQDATGTAGDDGIIIFSTDAHGPASFVGIMANAVHPTDPSGNYYRQWQGIWQEPSAAETIKAAELGHNFDGTGNFVGGLYASEDISPDISLVLNDILTINWKVSVG
ncbi:hypothetical protein LCGC14_0600700 [marine sediment metagenome]|uniref:Uncharacterized protein n=1 Tax=marine sediment metagenome TaxID=412755 RepID=A0A0F9RF98_9ZZZZ